jgi:NAD+ synthase (glutamine-hydrolysing)
LRARDSRGRILGVVPEVVPAQYREYYEKRWFAMGFGLNGMDIAVAGQLVPFGTDLIFAAEDLDDFIFHMEICEDYWAPQPPSTVGALSGALILCNLSASNITIGKADERKLLCASQSSRCCAAYIYAPRARARARPTSPGTDRDRSTNSARCSRNRAASRAIPSLRGGHRRPAARLERMRMGHVQRQCDRRRAIPRKGARGSISSISRASPTSASSGALRASLCARTAASSSTRIATRPSTSRCRVSPRASSDSGQASRHRRSGGLDSTHALIVAAKVCDYLEIPRTTILGFTMPGFATGDTTKSNAWALMNALGIVGAEIDIRPAAQQMLSDMGHPFAKGEPVYDVTFENVQAGLRTDYLFRLANHNGGFVVGTGDLSELALGWCTYGVGDQMSHYGVNAGVPKTLIQYLIRWVIKTGQFDAETNRILGAILDTKISPELVPADEAGMQSTEDRIGPLRAS